MPELTDKLPGFLQSVIGHALLFGLLAGLYFATNRIFGTQRELGKRVILFLGGGGSAILGTFLFVHAFSTIATHGVKAMMAGLFAAVFVLAGLWCVLVSLFASNGYVSNVLYDFLRGL